MKKSVSVLVVVCALIFASVLQAGGIFYVDVNGPNDPGTGSFDDPFRKIQDAIDVAINGDIIEIRPGLYTGEKNYNLNPNGLSITIRSIDPNDSNVVASTIIDPNKAGRGFYFDSDEDANCIISGFTLRNGYADGSGGAIFLNNSDPTIRNCVIIDNIAVLGGGGIHCYYSNPTLKNCVIAGNMTQGNGGGIWCFNSSSSRIINCTISSNEANWYGDGIYCHVSNVIITNSIFWSNDFNDIYVASGNVDVNYCDIQGGWVGGSGNIDSDPCFACFDSSGDPNIWDFHLKSHFGRWKSSIYTNLDPSGDGFINLVDFAAFASFWQKQGSFIPADLDNSGLVDLGDLKLLLANYLASYLPGDWVFDDATSPCIDAGNPNSTWTHEPWPNGKRINMGAYGGNAEASKNGNIADFDVSGAVNLIDLMEFSSKWLDEEAGIVNLDLAGRVDFADFAVFSDNWFWQKE